MKHHTIVVRLGPEDVSVVEPTRSHTHITEISFVDGDRRLRFGLGQTIDQLGELGLRPSETSVDLVIFAAAITAADTRISRKSESQDSWTREIEVHVPVQDPATWNSVAALTATTLNFLTGDRWTVQFRPRTDVISEIANKPKKVRTAFPTAVSLFSGGLDSFIGAIDLLDAGERPIFVSHYWDSITSQHQTKCAQLLTNEFAPTEVRHIRARVGFPNSLVTDVAAENTLRARSFLFFALAAMVADALTEEVVIHVPENGLISLNVPLDPLRLGALSTRTTHPFYMARFNQLIHSLGLRAQLRNRYAHLTKGQMAKSCARNTFLQKEASNTMSCSSPASRRYDRDQSQRAPKHCGRCVPCLIRRAAFLEAWGTDKTLYRLSDLKAQVLDTTMAEGEHVRAFQIALSRLQHNPGRAKFDIHGPGPLTDHLSDLAAYEAVYVSGLQEVGRLLEGVRARPR